MDIISLIQICKFMSCFQGHSQHYVCELRYPLEQKVWWAEKGLHFILLLKFKASAFNII